MVQRRWWGIPSGKGMTVGFAAWRQIRRGAQEQGRGEEDTRSEGAFLHPPQSLWGAGTLPPGSSLLQVFEDAPDLMFGTVIVFANENGRFSFNGQET